MHLKDSLQQVLDDLVLVLLARLLDLLDLCLGRLVRLVFGLLVPLGVLLSPSVSCYNVPCEDGEGRGGRSPTSAWYFLNSSSFFAR